MRKSDGVKMANGAIQSYTQQKNEFELEFKDLCSRQNTLHKQLQESMSQLCQGLIQSVDTAKIQAVAEETGALFLMSSLKKQFVKLSENESRSAEIGGIEEYCDRDKLLNPNNGVYTLAIAKEKGELKFIDDALKVYDFKEFQWLYKKGFHEEKEVNHFNKFMRFITLAPLRESKAEVKVLEHLKCSSFLSAAEEYDSLCVSKKEFEKEVQHWQSLEDELRGLIKEKAKVDKSITLFEVNCLSQLQSELASHLDGVDFSDIHQGIRPAGKILSAKCHALQEKIDYFENMKTFLKKEIRDRQDRINSISRVKSKWSKKPYDRLRGDKSKWLVTVPNMKRSSTTKRVRWMQTMNYNIYSYDSYSSYSTYMALDSSFLAYDAFAFGAEERMPYEGFTREVIEDLGEYRDENEQEKADYSNFKEGQSEEEADYSEDWDVSEEDAEAAAAAAMASEALANEESDGEEASLADDS